MRALSSCSDQRPPPHAAPSAARRILCRVLPLFVRGSADALLPLWQAAFLAAKCTSKSV